MATFVSACLAESGAQQIVTWSPSKLTFDVRPGDSVLRSVLLKARSRIANVRIEVSGEGATLLTTAPTAFDTLRAEVPVAITFSAAPGPRHRVARMAAVAWLRHGTAIVKDSLPIVIDVSVSERNQWIGLILPPFPEEVSVESSRTIGDARFASHSLDLVDTPSGRALWLSRRAERLDDEKWEVVATVPLPILPEGQGLILGRCGSLRTGENQRGRFIDVTIDPEIIAVVLLTEGEVLTEIRRAWRANRPRNTIEPVEHSALACVAEKQQ